MTSPTNSYLEKPSLILGSGLSPSFASTPDDVLHHIVGFLNREDRQELMLYKV